MSADRWGGLIALRGRLRAAAALPARDWPALAESWLAIAAARRSIRTRPLAALAPGRPSRKPAPGGAEERATEAARIDRLVRIAARYRPVPATCLPRSVALQRLLARRGIPAALRIGIQREAGRIHAHAWVECDGRPVGDPEEVAEKFVSLFDSE